MQFDDFLRQQAHGPAVAAIRRGEAGVEPAVKGDRWRFGAGFTNEGGVQPLLHEALFEVLDGAGARAWTNFGAVVLPLRVESRNCLRSFSVRVIRYRFAMRTFRASSKQKKYELLHVTGY
jgi:hypothetical protein